MHEKKIYSMLLASTKIQSLGYNKKELRGIATLIANNLASDESTAEEEVEAEIDKQIDTIAPLLAFGQSQSNRILDEWKKAHPIKDDDDNDVEPVNNQKQPKEGDGKKADDAPAWAQSILGTMTALKAEIDNIKGDKITDQRRGKLQALLKDTGVFGERTLKQFSRITFKDEDDFNDYLSDVELDIKNLNQERANAGLSELGKPASVQKGRTDSKPYSADEIKEIFH